MFRTTSSFEQWSRTLLDVYTQILGLILAMCQALYRLPALPDGRNPAEELIRSATAYAMGVMDSEGPTYPIVMAQTLPVSKHIVLRAALQRLIANRQLVWIEDFFAKLPADLRKWVAREHAQAVHLLDQLGRRDAARRLASLIDQSGFALPG